MIRRFTAAALAAALAAVLAGCGWEAGEASGLEDTQTLLAVDGRAVPAWRYLCWLRREQESSPAAGSSPDQADSAKERALADTVVYAVLEAMAEEWGCALTEEDKAGLAERWREQCAERGGEASYLEEIAPYHLDRERWEELEAAGLLYGKLCARCRAGEGGAPDESELDALAKERGEVRVDRILASFGEDREAARQRAEEFFARLNGAEDQAALFAALAQEGDDSAGPRPLEELDESLRDAAGALSPGQISGILESPGGYSLLLRLPPDRETLLDAWLDGELLSRAQNANVELTERYSALDVSEPEGSA